MATFIATSDHLYTFRPIKTHVRTLSYERLFRLGIVPGGTYVFTDMERLSAHELSLAAEAAYAMRESGSRVVNDPARALSRGDLLARLHAAGINRFRAWPAAQHPRPDCFPVLIKASFDHRQLVRELFHDQPSLEAALETLRRQGVPLRDLLVIEFSASPIREGAYRKHSVFRVCEKFLSYTPVIEDSWFVKYGKKNFSTDAELDQAIAEMQGNPFAGAMHPVFDLAGVDYGRVDFGHDDRGISVFEINSNPSLPQIQDAHRNAAYLEACNRAAQAIYDAIEALPDTGGAPVRLPWAGAGFQRFKRRFRRQPKRP